MCHNPYAAYQFARRCADLAHERAVTNGSDPTALAQYRATLTAEWRAYDRWRASIDATGYVGPADDNTYGSQP